MGVGSPTTSAPGRWFYKQEYVQEIEKELNGVRAKEPRWSEEKGESLKGINQGTLTKKPQWAVFEEADYVECTWEWGYVHTWAYTNALAFSAMPHHTTYAAVSPTDIKVSKLSFWELVGKLEPFLLQLTGPVIDYCVCFRIFTHLLIHWPSLQIFIKYLLCARFWVRQCLPPWISKTSEHRSSKHRNECKIVTHYESVYGN